MTAILNEVLAVKLSHQPYYWRLEACMVDDGALETITAFAQISYTRSSLFRYLQIRHPETLHAFKPFPAFW